MVARFFNMQHEKTSTVIVILMNGIINTRLGYSAYH